jgi:hypothetical protein
MSRVDHRKNRLLECLYELEAQARRIKPVLRGYIYIATKAIETVLLLDYDLTREEIDRLRRLS